MKAEQSVRVVFDLTVRFGLRVMVPSTDATDNYILKYYIRKHLRSK